VSFGGDVHGYVKCWDGHQSLVGSAQVILGEWVIGANGCAISPNVCVVSKDIIIVGVLQMN